MKKYSVTALLQKAGQRIFMEEEQTPEEKRTPDYVARAMRRYSTERLPAFMTRWKTPSISVLHSSLNT